MLLVDGDPLGGGIDLVLGGESDRGLRWSDLLGAAGRVPAAALAEALPRAGGLSYLSWDRASARAVPANRTRRANHTRTATVTKAHQRCRK